MTDKTVDVAELVKQHAELGEQIVKLGGTVTAIEKSEEEPVKKVERVKLDKGKFKAKDDEEDPEDMLDGGADEDTEDAKGKKMKKADEEIEKGADETLEYQGQAIKKSVVGDAQFAIIKSLTEAVTKGASDIAKANDDALMARMEKRAGDDFAHVPGTVQERASMLKAIGAMEEPLRKSFEAVLTAAEKLAKSAFDTVGKGGGDQETMKKSKQDFETKVTEVAKRDSISRPQALSKARIEFPDEFKAYQEAN